MSEMSRAVKRIGMVIVGLGVVAALVIEGTARFRVEARYQEALKIQRKLEQQLTQVRDERNRLFEVVQREQKKSEQLAKELSAKDQQLQDIGGRLAQESTVVKDLRTKLADSQQHFERTQDELALALQSQATSASSGSDKTIRLEKVVVAASGPGTSVHPGRVVSVNPDWRFVVIDFGWDRVEIGDVVSIYRNEELLGKARIERVQEDVAAATLLPEWIQAEIRVDDVVRVL